MEGSWLLIRADAGPGIGGGHVMRCLALAQAWMQSGGRACFAMAEGASSFGRRLTAENCRVETIRSIPGSADDARQSANIARRLAARWIVLDGYHLTGEFQHVLSEEFSRVAGRVPQLARIDDCGIDAPLPADVLVNQNLHANPRLYAGCSSDAKLLLGPTYALLRREFAPWRTWQRRISPRAHRLLVTLGGSDDDNVAGKVIEALWMCSGLALDVRLVIGPAYAHRAKLAVACERLGVRVERGVTDMTPLLAWADVAITAAGSTTWEAAFFGLPAIVLTLADNQREIAASAHDAGLVINLGWHADVGPERIAEALTKLCDAPQLRQAMSQRGRRIVDGLGAGRVVEHLTRAAA